MADQSSAAKAGITVTIPCGQALVVRDDDGRMLVTITRDGQPVLAPHLRAETAAREFWQAVAALAAPPRAARTRRGAKTAEVR